MAKTRIKVHVYSRDIPGAERDAPEGQVLTQYPGYGAAGIYFPAGESEHVVTDTQLAELRQLVKPTDSEGRPQSVPFTFQELGPAPDDALGDSDSTPPQGTPAPVVPALTDERVPVTRYGETKKSKG